VVATSDDSSHVLLEDDILEFPVGDPADSESAYAEHMWY